MAHKTDDSRDFATGEVHSFFDHFLCFVALGVSGIIVQAVDETAIGDNSLCKKDIQPVRRFGWMAGYVIG